jgi:hypothetical protein
VVEECRRLGLNPEAYLTEALIRLPAATNRDLPKLTPAALAPLLTPPEVCALRAARSPPSIGVIGQTYDIYVPVNRIYDGPSLTAYHATRLRQGP